MKICLPSLKKGTRKNKKKSNGGVVGNGPPANIIIFDSNRTLPVDTSWRLPKNNTPELSDKEEAYEEEHDAANAAVGACPTSSAPNTPTTATVPQQPKETPTDARPMDESQPTTSPVTDNVTATVTTTPVTAATTSSATRRTSLPPPPRRPSLKHTSSYSSTTDNSADVGTLHAQRRHSMSHVTGTSTSSTSADHNLDRRGNVATRSASMSHVTKNSISFDQTVSFVTIPRLSDICTQYPQSVFYSKKDFDEMSVLVRKDAERINGKKAKSSKRSTKSSTAIVQDDNALCDIGIEHRICTAKERFDREAKARAAVVSVLREQSRHRRQLRRRSSPHSSGEDLESTLARASINATKEAIVRARERAAHVERHCHVDTDSQRRNSVPPTTAGEGRKMEKKASWMAYF